jgi:hypothetical protein
MYYNVQTVKGVFMLALGLCQPWCRLTIDHRRLSAVAVYGSCDLKGNYSSICAYLCSV